MTMTYSPEVLIGRYVGVWSEPDPAARREAVSGLWTPDGVEFVEGARFSGHEELIERIAEAYVAFVGSGKYVVTCADDVTVHDDLITFTVQLTAGNTIAWAARVFLLLDPTGLIREDYHLTVKPLPAE
jgi:hypothetical protein